MDGYIVMVKGFTEAFSIIQFSYNFIMHKVSTFTQAQLNKSRWLTAM